MADLRQAIANDIAAIVPLDDRTLLVDHKDASLWLPTGGQVDAGEHPSDTVIRETKEELDIDAALRTVRPIMATFVNTASAYPPAMSMYAYDM